MARFDVTGVQTLRAAVSGEGAAPGGSRQQLPGGCQLLRQGLVRGGAAFGVRTVAPCEV